MSGEVTQAQRDAAAHAERLLNDPTLTGALDELTAMNTERAVFGATQADRDEARMMVLAIGQLRGSLRGAVEYVLGARDRRTIMAEMEDRDAEDTR